MIEPRPTGIKTNGIGKRVDWLNRTRSMADDPEIRRINQAVEKERRAAEREYAARQAYQPRWAGDTGSNE